LETGISVPWEREQPILHVPIASFVL